MKVKKFQARDMAEAMRLVKAELGPNAIILHSRDLRRGLLGWFSRGGVEVTAGVDMKGQSANGASRNAAPKKNASNGRNPHRGSRFDTKVADKSNASVNPTAPLFNQESVSNPLLSPPAQKEDNPLLALSRKIVEENAKGKNGGGANGSKTNGSNGAGANGSSTNGSGANGMQSPRDNAPSPQEKVLEERLESLETRLIKLTGLIETLAPSIVSGDMPSVPSQTRELYNHLLEQDVDEHLALNLAMRIAESADEGDDVWTVLKSQLVSKIPVADPIELGEKSDRPKVLMLVGPTGVGKTTTLAKISAQYRYNPATKSRPKIVFITADLYRLAAVEQLQKYTEILGVELEVTYSPDEVRQALKKHKDAHLVLFDTAGTCQRNLPQMSTLGSIVEACHPDEVHLVMSATTKYSDMVDIVDHFKEIKPTRILFTKIDESTTYGPILNTVAKFKMPVSYLTTGQNVPEDIERAKPERIAKMILSKPTVNRIIDELSGPEKPGGESKSKNEAERKTKPDETAEKKSSSETMKKNVTQEQCNETTNS